MLRRQKQYVRALFAEKRVRFGEAVAMDGHCLCQRTVPVIIMVHTTDH